VAASPAATVVIPTFDHGTLISFAIESALAQTIADIDVFVVGDGVPDVTRALMAELARCDTRIRFFDNPKGKRLGELHRHAALAEARAPAVLYLCDDDLWLPDHVATMLDVLGGADLARAVALNVSADATITVSAGLQRGYEFERGVSRGSGSIGIAYAADIPLSCAAHTLEAYRRLPHGWQPAPRGIASDRHMWEQFLTTGTCRVAGATRATVVRLRSQGQRAHMSHDERLAELSEWWSRINDEWTRADFDAAVLAAALARFDELVDELLDARAKVATLQHRLRASRNRAKTLDARLLGTRQKLEQKLEHSRQTLEHARQRVRELEAELRPRRSSRALEQSTP
jgi:GalNAc5-diNAcBac-PP-undecaprenol beta-1,3-glucosyltransferase